MAGALVVWMLAGLLGPGCGADVPDGDRSDRPGCVDLDPADHPTWFADTDADTFGDAASTVRSCEPPDGYVANGAVHDRAHAATISGGRREQLAPDAGAERPACRANDHIVHFTTVDGGQLQLIRTRIFCRHLLP